MEINAYKENVTNFEKQTDRKPSFRFQCINHLQNYNNRAKHAAKMPSFIAGERLKTTSLISVPLKADTSTGRSAQLPYKKPNIKSSVILMMVLCQRTR